MCFIFAVVSTLQKPNDHLPVFMAGRSGPVYQTGIGPIVSAYSVTSYVCSGSYTPDSATSIYRAKLTFQNNSSGLTPTLLIFTASLKHQCNHM